MLINYISITFSKHIANSVFVELLGPNPHIRQKQGYFLGIAQFNPDLHTAKSR